jgi:hypothetical protein
VIARPPLGEARQLFGMMSASAIVLYAGGSTSSTAQRPATLGGAPSMATLQAVMRILMRAL